jgi:hypothetical protein
MPAILAFRRLRQEVNKSEDSLNYIARLSKENKPKISCF